MPQREKMQTAPPPSGFAPLGQAVMESFAEGIVVFDPYGRVIYANQRARKVLDGLGEAVFLPDGDDAKTLAERERRAILDTLEATHGKLAETARRLGISRTTLWRRLRAYGLPANGRGGQGPTTRV